MKKLVISDALEKKQRNIKGYWKTKNIDLCSWEESLGVRLSDYGIAVLDLNLGKSSWEKGMFEGKQRDIYKMLDAGGVIVSLNHLTRLTSFPLKEYKYETNYHWFAEFNPELVDINAKPGKNIKLISEERLFKEYFKGVTQYHKTLTSIRDKGKFLFLFLKWKIFEDSIQLFQKFFPLPPLNNIINMFRYTPNLFWYKGEAIAINEITGEPIANVVDVRRGNLIFLPENTQSTPSSLIEKLCEIGEKYYEKNREKIGLPSEAPGWLEEYKTNQEKEIEKRISGLKEQVNQLEGKKKKFEEIDVLLYGFGKPLQNAVQKVFESWDCEVTPTQPGATMDFKVKEPIKKLRFALEVTGIKDKVHKDSYKVSQALQYLTRKEKDEKIAILTNTYREKKIAERPSENFTQPVIEIAENNEFCLMTTADLYSLWRVWLNEKRSKEEIIRSIFDTVGAYKHSKP